MGPLSTEGCVACRRDSPRVTEAEIAELGREVPDWQLLERDGIAQLERVFHFPSFADALAFTNRVGALAEEEGHHPALLTEWGRVTPAGHAPFGGQSPHRRHLLRRAYGADGVRVISRNILRLRR